MADGRTHATYSAIAASACTALAIPGAMLHPSIAGVALGAWFAHIATPDLDHHARTYDERRIYRASVVLGIAWQVFWHPYQKLNRHRGRSHTWAGTVERFLYFWWLPAAVSCIVEPDEIVVLFWVCAFVGQLCVDCVHYYLDWS